MLKNIITKEKFQEITDKIAKFIAKAINKSKDLFEKLKKLDKRFLILMAVAAVLVIVLFALIVNGISKSGDNNKPIESEGMSNISEVTTDYEEPAAVQGNTGIYKVQTGSSSHLNMREAADKNSDKVGQIPNGTAVEILYIDDTEVTAGTAEYGWGYVRYNGVRGWVYMEYLIK